MEAKKGKKNALKDVGSWSNRVSDAFTRKVGLFSNELVGPSHMARITAELCQSCVKIPMQSKALAKVARLKSPIKSLEENVSFYKASEEKLKVNAQW